MRAPIAMPIGRWRQGIEARRLRGAADGEPARFSLRLAGPVQGGALRALINTNQRGQPLAHSIEIAGARHVIVGAELAAALPRPKRFSPQRRTSGSKAAVDGMADLDHALGRAARHFAGQRAARRACAAKDRAFFIYTSGTTGLPKAANFSHMRMLFMMSGFVGALQPTRKRPHL